MKEGEQQFAKDKYGLKYKYTETNKKRQIQRDKYKDRSTSQKDKSTQIQSYHHRQRQYHHFWFCPFSDLSVPSNDDKLLKQF